MSDLQVNIIGYGYLGPDNMFSHDKPGGSAITETVFDVRPLLRDKKSFKFMAKQDQMAVYAAIKAMEKSGLASSALEKNTGVYFTIGSIPFEQQHLDLLSNKSVDPEHPHEFNMARFSTEALNALNPLLTFKCLPNMPVFHVSYNLGITGRYYLTYPGAGQWLQTLQQAMQDLSMNKIDYALVGAVADQRNPLVRHHVQRSHPGSIDSLIDSACVLILSNDETIDSYGKLDHLKIQYSAQNALSQAPDVSRIRRTIDNVDAGPVDPSLWIAQQLDMPRVDKLPNNKHMKISTLDGITAELRLTLS